VEINISKIASKLGELAAILAVVGVAATYWINTEVERRMNELAVDPAASPVVVELVTEVDNIEATVDRVEDKVDAFSQKFIEYLERQANQ
jgi:hypothetical protein